MIVMEIQWIICKMQLQRESDFADIEGPTPRPGE
jgi:hypothetical protein